jgi:hypothetical protein
MVHEASPSKLLRRKFNNLGTVQADGTASTHLLHTEGETSFSMASRSLEEAFQTRGDTRQMRDGDVMQYPADAAPIRVQKV